MIQSASHLATLEQCLALPDDGRRHELVHGWMDSEPLLPGFAVPVRWVFARPPTPQAAPPSI